MAGAGDHPRLGASRVIRYRPPNRTTIYDKNAYVRGALQQEDEFNLLQENGPRLLLEQEVPDLTITQTTLATSLDIQLDMVPVVDVSDTTNSPNGRTKHISVGELGEAIGIFNVKKYGVTLDGVTDDTAAWEDALNDISSGQTLLCAGGTSKVTSLIDVPAVDVKIIGHHATINSTHATSVFRQQNRGNLFEIDGLAFTGTAKAFHYDALDLPAGPTPFQTQHFEYHIRNCRFLQDATTEALYLYGAREGLVRDCYFETNKGIYTSFSIEPHVVNCHFKNTAQDIFSDTGSEGLKVIGGMSLGSTTGIRCSQNAGVQLLGILWDGSQPVLLQGTTEVGITNCYIASRTSNPAIETAIVNAVRCQNISITGCPALISNYNNASSYSIILAGTDKIVIADSHIFNWQANGISYSDTTYLDVHDNVINPKAATGTYSIACTGTDSATNRIHNNVLGKTMNGITTKNLWNNAGYVTENGGTDAVASGTTSKTVTHGLAGTPDPQNIDVVFVVQGTNDYGRWWIGNIGATTFDVFVSVDPGSSLTFYWKARIKT